VQFSLPSAAAVPNGHCLHVAEPIADIAPFGQTVHEDMKLENWFGLAVFAGQKSQLGLFIAEHTDVKYAPAPQSLLQDKHAEPSATLL